MNNPIESKPLFAVGEVVILQSKNCQECNGEYQIIEALGPGKSTVVDGIKTINNTPRYAYDLGVTSPNGNTFWTESSLRKRHQPSEYSFEDLKTILYLPQSRDEIARLVRGMQA